MTTARLPYVRRKRGNLFWEPTPAMRALGFTPKPLGPESADSIAEARRLYDSWVRANAEPQAKASAYPAGSLGAYFERMQLTAAWAKKSPRTREDYHLAWKRLAPLARTTLTRITVDDVERLADDIEEAAGPHERYRAIKILRAIFADAIVRLKLTGYPSPAKGVRNPQPRGRSQIWLGAEIPLLVAAAERLKMHGMALAIRIAWDTLFSPVDVRTLSADQIRRDTGGAYIERPRTKTGAGAYGHLTAATEAAIAAYIAGLGVTLAPGAPIIRQRDGNAYRTKDTWAADFRDVRREAFGPDERRQFQDLRRSGNVEADAAGADKATMAEILANTMDASRFLDETYTPPTVAKARDVARLRLQGRKKLAGEVTRRGVKA